jgi:hypothetical protein
MARQNAVGSVLARLVNPPVRWLLADPDQVVDLVRPSKER